MASLEQHENQEQDSPRPRRRSGLLLEAGTSLSGRNLRASFGQLGKMLSWKKHGWQCKSCTYRNENMDFLSCEVCGTIRIVPPTEARLVDGGEADENDVAAAAVAAAAAAAAAAATTTTNDNDNDNNCYEDPRFTQASSEQEMHLEACRKEREEEDFQKILDRRMQEIVDRQRELYDQMAQKQVRRSSLKLMKETQKSIDTLQVLLARELSCDDPQQQPSRRSFTPVTPDRRKPPPPPPPSPSSNHFEVGGMPFLEPRQKSQQPQPPQQSQPPPQPPPPHHRPYPAPSRRQLRMAQTIANPVDTMKTNPWEEKTMGMQDLLNVQSELWNRVRAEDSSSSPEPKSRRFRLKSRTGHHKGGGGTKSV